MDGPVIYQHPLAYLLGLEGIALLRAFAGAYGSEFTRARLGETRALLEAAAELGEGVEARPITTRQGYAAWARSYDEPGNQLVDIEGPIVRGILDDLPVGVALDAACGTGRHLEHLAARGHEVIGVDSSAEMLAVARRKVPGATFHEAELDALPVAEASVDLVVCALALTHLPDLAPPFAEFVRVLRPGGHLVVSDSRGLIGDIGLPLVRVAADGSVGYMQTWSRLASDYLAVALPLGLHVRRCEEPRRPGPLVAADSPDPPEGTAPRPFVAGGPPDIWALHGLAAEAANAAWHGNPVAIVWHFERPPDGRGTGPDAWLSSPGA